MCAAPATSRATQDLERADVPMHYLFDAAQANLDNSVRHDTPPPHAARIEVDGAGNIAVDQYGNALGGARTPWLDVPTVTYYPSSAPDSCRLQGHRTPFDQAQLAGHSLPGTTAITSERFITEIDALVHQGWLTPADADARSTRRRMRACSGDRGTGDHGSVIPMTVSSDVVQPSPMARRRASASSLAACSAAASDSVSACS